MSDENMTPPPAPESSPAGDVPKDARTMAMLCHLLAIFTGFLGPLIIWLIKKDEMPFVNDQGKEALNFQITMFLAYIVSWLSIFVFIGCVLFPAVVILNLVFCIIATMKANEGVAYRYPFALRLVK
ncbi:MAG: DUF4870 domain-containing protein [Phycisphaeraceae bacterium]|nr:DUF4870 domain-containing protein [Phycisphaeraceae bacterium]